MSLVNPKCYVLSTREDNIRDLLINQIHGF